MEKYENNSNINWKDLYYLELEKNKEINQELQSYIEDSKTNLEYIIDLEGKILNLRKENSNLYQTFNEKLHNLKFQLLESSNEYLDKICNSGKNDETNLKAIQIIDNKILEEKIKNIEALNEELSDENSELNSRNSEISSAILSLENKLKSEIERGIELQEVIMNLKNKQEFI